jgi:hypothetical protein
MRCAHIFCSLSKRLKPNENRRASSAVLGFAPSARHYCSYPILWIASAGDRHVLAMPNKSTAVGPPHSDPFEIGPDLVWTARRLGLERLVTKRRDRPYQPWPVEALDQGEEPQASGDEPVEGCFRVNLRLRR